MSFSITLQNHPPPEVEPEAKVTLGTIQIGAFEERFSASLEYWNKNDYQKHWKTALNRIVNGTEVSCLITSMADPRKADFIFWWPMYRTGEKVHFQNQILFFEQLSAPFNENDPFASIKERETVTEEGHQISEWSVPISDLRDFLKHLEGPPASPCSGNQ